MSQSVNRVQTGIHVHGYNYHCWRSGNQMLAASLLSNVLFSLAVQVLRTTVAYVMHSWGKALTPGPLQRSQFARRF